MARESPHGTVPINAEILARFHALLPRVVASRSAAWHRAWLMKLLARLAGCAYLLYGMHQLGWSPAILLGFLVVATWTGWFCDLLAIWLRSRAWQDEVDADAEHAFVVQVLRARDKPHARVADPVISTGSTPWGASAFLGGIATACIAFFWMVSPLSFYEAFRAEPLALAMLAVLLLSMLVSTLPSAAGKSRKPMAGLSTGGPISRLLALWLLIFLCFFAADGDAAALRVLMTAFYALAIFATLVGIAAMPSLVKQTSALRAAMFAEPPRAEPTAVTQ